MAARNCFICKKEVTIGQNTISDEDNSFWHDTCVIKPNDLKIFGEIDLSKFVPENVGKIKRLCITRDLFIRFFARKLAILASKSDIVFNEKTIKSENIDIEKNNIKILTLNQTTKSFAEICKKLNVDPAIYLEKIREAYITHPKTCLNIYSAAKTNGIPINYNKYNIVKIAKLCNWELYLC